MRIGSNIARIQRTPSTPSCPFCTSIAMFTIKLKSEYVSKDGRIMSVQVTKRASSTYWYCHMIFGIVNTQTLYTWNRIKNIKSNFHYCIFLCEIEVFWLRHIFTYSTKGLARNQIRRDMKNECITEIFIVLSIQFPFFNFIYIN